MKTAENHKTITLTQAVNNFEQEYLAIRKKENRIYTDDEVRLLPGVNAGHIHYSEWLVRKHSCEKLVHYLLRKKKALKILEVGCGNGWLSHKLSLMPGAEVTGIDLNTIELEQAKRVFNCSNLEFIRGTITDINEQYDIIVFAASFQYFRSAEEILNTACELLKENGEIHIIDTKFYSLTEGIRAAERSRIYFENAGSPGMEDYYFHHALDDLADHRFKIMFDPEKFINKLFKQSPFPWIRIKKC